jgi:hypothetical protein
MHTATSAGGLRLLAFGFALGVAVGLVAGLLSPGPRARMTGEALGRHRSTTGPGR